jgi:hypothetical protein
LREINEKKILKVRKIWIIKIIKKGSRDESGD